MKNESVIEVEASPVEILEDEMRRLSVVLTKPEYDALANLLSIRFKPSEIEALEKSFPQYGSSELFAVAKLKQLAKDEIVASEWRRNGQEWKNQATSYTRQLGSSEDVIRKYAQHQIVELADRIPSDYHEATIKHVIVKLDKGSQDSRVIELQKLFKS